MPSGINRSPSQLCLMVQGCGHWCDFYCDEARRCVLEARRLARVPSKNIEFLMLAPKVFGARARRRRLSSCPTAGLQRQEYHLRLKRLPPIRRGGWFPPFKILDPRRSSGLLRLRLSIAVVKRQLTFPFWKQKLRLAHFSLQNGIHRIPGREGENTGRMAQSRGPRRGPRDDGHSNNQLTNPYYYEHQSHHHQR